MTDFQSHFHFMELKESNYINILFQMFKKQHITLL